jgi:hypothetical protein
VKNTSIPNIVTVPKTIPSGKKITSNLAPAKKRSSTCADLRICEKIKFSE